MTEDTKKLLLAADKLGLIIADLTERAIYSRAQGKGKEDARRILSRLVQATNGIMAEMGAK